MANIGSVQSTAQSVYSGILRAADDNPAVAVALLKKAIEGDKDLVSTLLPCGNASGGRVNTAA